MRPRVALLLFALLFVAYALAGAWTASRIRPSGDEPYYYLAADSLLHGEGFELTRRYEALAGADYAPPDLLRDLDGSVAPSLARPGRFPLHDLGLSILIAPAYAIGHCTGVDLLIAACMAAAVAVGAVVSAYVAGSVRLAAASAFAVGLAAPALTYSSAVFPDAVAALPVAATLAAVAGVVPPWSGGVAIAFLPLLHLRFWPLALGLAGALIAVRRPRRRGLVVLLAPTVAAVILMSAVDLAVYGIALPHAGFVLFFAARRGADVGAYTGPGSLGILGLSVDRSFGLIPAAPIAILAFVGIGGALRTAVGRTLLASVVPYLVFVPFVDWTGGFSPQARYLAPLVPLLVVLLAVALTSRAARIAAVPLIAWTLAQSFVYVHSPGLRYDAYGRPPLSDQAWERLVPLSPSAVFPLFGTRGATAVLAAAWSLALAVVAALGFRACHTRVTGRAETPRA